MESTTSSRLRPTSRQTARSDDLPPAIGALIALGVVLGVAVLAWVVTVILTDPHPVVRTDAGRGVGVSRIAPPVSPAPIAKPIVVTVTATADVATAPTRRP